MNKLLLPLLLALGCTPGRLADDPGLPNTGPSDLSQAADVAQAADLPPRPDLSGPPTLTTKDLHAIWGMSPDFAVAVGDAGTVVRWDGASWALMTSGTSADLYAVWGASASDVWTVGKGGAIFHFDGAAWSAQASPVTANLHAIHGRGASDVWAAGEAWTLLHWNGGAWSKSMIKPLTYDSADAYAVWLGTASDLWQILDPHYMRGFPLQGDVVTITVTDGSLSGASFPMMKMNALYGASETAVWTVGDGGSCALYAKDPMWGGQLKTSGVTANLNAVHGLASDDFWAVGDAGTAIHWNGTSWTTVPTGASGEFAGSLAGVWAFARKEAWIVGQKGTIERVRAP